MIDELNYAVNCSILFTELPLHERPAAAATAGFRAVEFWWPFQNPVPADREVDAFVRSIEDAGVALIGLNFFAGDMAAGDRGVLSLPTRTGLFRDNIDVVVELGRRLDCRAFNALYGKRLDGESTAMQDELTTEQLTLAARAVDAIGGFILIEALSGADGYPLLHAADVVEVIERVEQQSAVNNLRWLNDVYHLAVNGDDVPLAIEKFQDRIGHVQIADSPGRNEPGTGTLPLELWMEQIRATGYDGWIALEYKPSGASVDSFAWIEK